MSKGKILIIEDQEVNRIICKKHLRCEDFKIFEADNGKNGLEKANDIKPDLVLLDLKMPVMDGFETLIAFKNNLELKDIPILMLTGSGSLDDVVKTLNMGAQDYVKKPFNGRELIARCTTLIKMKKAEEKLRNSITILEHEAAMGKLLAGVSHDINNIIHGSKALIDIIKKLVEKKQYFDIPSMINCMQNDINLMAVLSNSLTNFAKGVDTERTLINICSLINLPLNILKRKIRNYHIETIIELNDVMMVKCNACEIQQVVLNLIVNAIHAVEKKKNPKLIIRSWIKKNEANISFTDNGHGIPDNIIANIFDNLFTTKKQGAGIGLSTVKKIINGHNGNINVTSEEGKGSTFIISLPLANCK
jgi:signal transduction histidine kinase